MLYKYKILNYYLPDNLSSIGYINSAKSDANFY